MYKFIREGSPVRMDGFESEKIKREVEELEEIEELFHAVAENLKSEDTNTVDTKPAILSVIEDIPLLSHCRLCTIPNNNMVDIFSSDAMSKNILSKINHCLPVTVKKMDALPKQVCRSCLEEVERCHRFHQTVVEAEKQLLALSRVASSNLEEMKKNFETLAQCDRKDGLTEQDNIDETFETSSDSELGNNTSTSRPDRDPTVDNTVKRNALLSYLRPCSVVLSVVEIGCKDNSEANGKEKSPSNSKRRNPDLTSEATDLATTTASGIVQQTTCDSEVTESTSCRSTADEIQGNGAKHQVDEAVRSSFHTGERHHRCTICAKTFKTKKSLSVHLNCHSSHKEPYKCDVCSKMYKAKNDLATHLGSHFGPRKMYECNLCSKTFMSKKKLSRHVKVHSGPREMYKCELCSKTFVAKKNLSRHSKVHSGPRELYSCDLCSRIFISKSGLCEHHQSHTGVGPFSCEYCGKKFALKGSRNRHQLVHTGERRFKCTKCEKAFKQSSSLRKHTASVHSEKRNYSCSLCDKSFRTLRNRTNHMLVHTANENKATLYQCDHCERYTKSKSLMVLHLNSCKERMRSKNVIAVC